MDKVMFKERKRKRFHKRKCQNKKSRNKTKKRVYRRYKGKGKKLYTK